MLRKLAFWMLLSLCCCYSALAQRVTVFHTFNGADGSDSLAGLVQACDGNLYGTTTVGGKYGLGSVFRISLSGTLTTLYSCTGLPTGTVCNFGQPANSGENSGTALIWITAQTTASAAKKRDSAQTTLFYAITLPWLFLPFAAARRNRNRLRLCLGICGIAAAFFAALVLNGCDSTAIPYKAPPQTYNVTVTAASRVPTPSIYGNQTASTEIKLTVQNE